MGAQQYNSNNTLTMKAKVELPAALLEQLIISGLLPGSQCKCLNDSARQAVWKSLLIGSTKGGMHNVSDGF
jgi:hypothetical protein